MSAYIKINPADNVVVAIDPMRKGDTIEVGGRNVTVLQDVPAGHKIALQPFAAGEYVIK